MWSRSTPDHMARGFHSRIHLPVPVLSQGAAGHSVVSQGDTHTQDNEAANKGVASVTLGGGGEEKALGVGRKPELCVEGAKD